MQSTDCSIVTREVEGEREGVEKGVDETARCRPWALNDTWGTAAYHSPLQLILHYAEPTFVDPEGI